MTTITASFDLDLDMVAHNVATQNDHKVTANFIMLVDEYVADYEFTESLIKRLQDSLAREDEAANGSV